MKKRMNDKGQQLSTTTLILLVLGIIILVLVIIGISIGFGNLTDKINIFAGSNSISDIVLACKIDSSSNAIISYCTTVRKVTISGVKEKVTCQSQEVKDLLDQAEQLDCTKHAQPDETTKK